MLNSISVLLCINASYAQHAAVCIVSLLENNPHDVFDIVIAASEPLGPGEAALAKTVQSYPNASLKVIAFQSGDNLPLRSKRRSIDTYSRLWVSEFFPPQVDKVLYLDSDIVVVGPIRELWDSDLGTNVLAAVSIAAKSNPRCAVLDIPEEFSYFQCGVLLFNLNVWRHEQIFTRLIGWIEEHDDLIVDDDQDVLNACLYDRRLNLPYIWNVIVPFYFDYHDLGMSDDQRRAVQREARIIHYNEPSKPWHYLNRHPRRADYWKYLKLTEWRDYRPDDQTLFNRAKKMVGPLVPRRLRNYIGRALGEQNPT
jgi:lipopolysaccharide biosynthesis glycosyltransferase